MVSPEGGDIGDSAVSRRDELGRWPRIRVEHRSYGFKVRSRVDPWN